jgi:hypothetical protein
MNQDDTVERS